jgi:DNA mismatch repair ATPase MutS
VCPATDIRELAVGTQLVLAVEQWRAEHQRNFRSWLDAWAEFEALQALATYAYERPACTFPEFVEGQPVVEAEQLGHPLLGDDVCVCNDISLNRTSRFYLVSGSNMSGKSTFLWKCDDHIQADGGMVCPAKDTLISR